MSTRPISIAVAGLVGALLLSGCSGGSSASSSSAAGTTPAPTASASDGSASASAPVDPSTPGFPTDGGSATPAPSLTPIEAPVVSVGTCSKIPDQIIASPTLIWQSKVVPCTDEHTAVTLSVTPIPDVPIPTGAETPGTPEYTAFVDKSAPLVSECMASIADNIGTPMFTRFQPSVAYAKDPLGQTAVVCDMTLVDQTWQPYLPLPTPTEGAAATPKLAVGFAACIDPKVYAPNDCNSPGAAILYHLGYLDPSAWTDFPGSKAISEQVRKKCASLAASLGFTGKFEFVVPDTKELLASQYGQYYCYADLATWTAEVG